MLKISQENNFKSLTTNSTGILKKSKKNFLKLFRKSFESSVMNFSISLIRQFLFKYNIKFFNIILPSLMSWIRRNVWTLLQNWRYCFLPSKYSVFCPSTFYNLIRMSLILYLKYWQSDLLYVAEYFENCISADFLLIFFP